MSKLPEEKTVFETVPVARTTIAVFVTVTFSVILAVAQIAVETGTSAPTFGK